VFLLAASNVNYLIFNFLNLNAGWIHRVDRPNWERPYKCPTWLLGLGTVLSFVNLTIMGLGADVWGEGTLVSGVLAASLILPVFLFRHYIQDRGVFPKTMVEHLGEAQAVPKRSGKLPYIVLAAGVVVVLVAHSFAVY
jgi:amino acid transporter